MELTAKPKEVEELLSKYEETGEGKEELDEITIKPFTDIEN